MRKGLTLAILVFTWLASGSAQAATPAFSVHKNGTAQTIVGDTPTKLTWSTEVIDTNSNFATDRFTPTVAGNYLIVASVQCAQPGACVPAIYKNGALYAASRLTNQTFADQSPHVTAIVSMNGSTDYVEVFATSSGTSIVGAATQTYFSGSQIDGAGTGSSQWTDGAGGIIYYNGGNVGIGTTSPAQKLHVSGSGAVGAQIQGTTYGFVNLFTASNTSVIGLGEGGAMYLNTYQALPITLNTNNAERLRISEIGNVGIGTTSPLSKLSLGGVSNYSNRIALYETIPSDFRGIGMCNPGTSPDYWGVCIWANQTPNDTNAYLFVKDGGNVGIGTTTPVNRLSVVAGVDTWAGTFYGTATSPTVRLGTIGGVATVGANNNAGTLWADLSINPGGNTYFAITSGNVGIGTTAPSHILHIAGQGRSTVASWATSSDARVKEAVQTIDDGLGAIEKLRPVTFRYTDEYQNGNAALAGIRRGFIAQEVETVLPDAVTRSVEKVGNREISDFRVLGNSDFVPLLVSAVKELKADNDNLRAELDAIYAEIKILKAAK